MVKGWLFGSGFVSNASTEEDEFLQGSTCVFSFRSIFRYFLGIKSQAEIEMKKKKTNKEIEFFLSELHPPWGLLINYYYYYYYNPTKKDLINL